MIIDNLNTLPSPVQSTDEIPVERGTTTYKMPYSVIEGSIAQSTANIGTHVTSNQQTVSVTSGAFVTVASVNLSAGVYVVTGRIDFGTDATGRNISFLTTNSSATNNGVVNSTAGNGRSTLEITCRIGLESNGTVYLKAYKTAGTGNVDAYIDAIRLA
jgi:hypothetical protein